MALGQVEPEEEPIILVQLRERVRVGLCENGCQGVIADTDLIGTHPADVSADDPLATFRRPPDQKRMIVRRQSVRVAPLGNDSVEVLGDVGMRRDVLDTVKRTIACEDAVADLKGADRPEPRFGQDERIRVQAEVDHVLRVDFLDVPEVRGVVRPEELMSSAFAPPVERELKATRESFLVSTGCCLSRRCPGRNKVRAP